MAKAKKEDIKLFEFDAVNDALTDRQLLFCMEYIKCKFNGTEAAKKAGYSEDTAMEQASRLLSNVKVREKVEKYKADLGLRIGIDAEYLANTLLRWVESDITQTFECSPDELKALPLEVRRLITSYESTTRVTPEMESQTTVKLKFVSKEKAMEMLKQLLGYDKPTKIADTDKDGNDKAAGATINVIIGEGPALTNNENEIQ